MLIKVDKKVTPPAKWEKLADMYDIFGAQVNGRNFEGRKSIHTSIGLCWTTLVLVVGVWYALE